MAHINRREFLGLSAAGAAGMMLGGPLMSMIGQEADSEYNVLMIPVDDLRPQLGCYGQSMMHTPHIDRLASEGTLFSRAYCQQAVCGPSRASLMTGCRPDTTQVWDLYTDFRDAIPDVVTLPQQFMARGYQAEGLGKVYHGGLNDEQSWSVKSKWPKGKGYGTQESLDLIKRRREEIIAAGKDPKDRKNRVRGYPWEVAECEDDYLTDGALCSAVIERMTALQDQRFFLACGFVKPHLPFVAPRKYWDLYDHDAIELADNPFAPQDAPQHALSNWGELRVYEGMPSHPEPVTDEQARWLIHGYYACTSYVDAQVGRLLDALEETGLREKTVIVLWGDHGWQLGDHGMWCKHTNFETSVHAPVIASVPGQTPATCDALVEFVDIYPSLCELCGLPLPDTLEGDSFAPLIEDPTREWKPAAFSQYPRTVRGVGRCMGYSMRTDRYRFTRWAIPDKDFVEYELYDHEIDPKENVNIAGLPENAALVATLIEQMDAGWQGARPPA